MTITIADGRGALWQWDTGRRVRVGDGTAKQVHYQSRCFGRTVDVDVGEDGTAIIPDELLQDWHTLTAYAYVGDGQDGYTVTQTELFVHKRAKPAEYVYSPTEQITLRDAVEAAHAALDAVKNTMTPDEMQAIWDTN